MAKGRLRPRDGAECGDCSPASRCANAPTGCATIVLMPATLPAGTDSFEQWRDAVGREPTPDEAAVLAETVEQLLRGLDGDERSVVELSLQGYTTQEISETLGRAERSVRRLRERVRKRLEE